MSEIVALQDDQTAFNLAVWDRLLADSDLAETSYRIETNIHGLILKTPPPSFHHSQEQGQIAFLLQKLLPGGRALTECPLSTSDGVKAIDTAWMSLDRLARRRDEKVLTEAPEICVEVLSPSNTRAEMLHKKALYFEAGAKEVWFCSVGGELSFFRMDDPETAGVSGLCPDFPGEIEII